MAIMFPACTPQTLLVAVILQTKVLVREPAPEHRTPLCNNGVGQVSGDPGVVLVQGSQSRRNITPRAKRPTSYIELSIFPK